MQSEQEDHSSKQEEFINPIDKIKTAENPSTLPYAHTAGGAVIRPTEQGVIKGRALQAMEEQTDMHMGQIYDQMRLLAEQAKKLQQRTELSKKIYEADIAFEPLIGKVYHLYQRNAERYLLSLVGPEEWGKRIPFKAYCATVKMLADHTWDVLDIDDEYAQSL